MRGTRGLVLVAMALALCACEPVAAPLPETPPSPTLPATPVEPGVLLLRGVHAAMSESVFDFGGMQEWGRAVGQLEEAVPALARDPRFAPMAAELQALLPRARDLLTAQPALMECRSITYSGREANPRAYDDCWLLQRDSNTRRRGVHDEVTALLRQVELAR